MLSLSINCTRNSISCGDAVFIMRINFSLAVILASIFLFYASRQAAPILSFKLYLGTDMPQASESIVGGLTGRNQRITYMKCKSCKNEIDDESIYCKWCGTYQIRTRKKKKDIAVPKPTQLPSGMWRIQLRKEGESITEATEALCIAKAKAIRAGFIEQSKRHDTLTVGQAIDNYIADNTNILSPSTIRGYQIIRDNHFKDVMDCDAFSDVDYQKAVNDAAAKYSPKTIKNDWGLVTAALRYAKIEPPDINLPQKVVKELPWLSYTQIQQFLDIVKGEPCELPALLALHSLRRSELLDLERADIAEDCITVHGSRVPNNKNRLVHKETNKTSASTRTVPIVIPRLKEILPNEDGYLIRCYCNTPTIQINRLCRANNLPEVGLHGLRRSFASLAHHLGWDVRTTMRYGGWSDYKTMNDFYIKLDESDLLRDATKMVEFYSGAVS